MDDEDEAPNASRDGEVDGLALAAFVFSLVSLVVPFVMTAVSVVLARKASGRIDAAVDGRRGRQLALAAQVVALTWAGLLVLSGVTIAAMASLMDDDPNLEARELEDVDAQLYAEAFRDRPFDYRVLAREPVAAVPVEPVDAVTFQTGDDPFAMRFEPDAVLSYSITGSRLVLAIVGRDEREIIARCDASCDGRVEVGRFQSSELYELEIDTDAGWYVHIEGAREVVD